MTKQDYESPVMKDYSFHVQKVIATSNLGEQIQEGNTYEGWE